MPTPGRGSIGGLDYSPEERHRLATKSRDWKCDTCGHAATLVLPVGAAERSDQEQKEMEDIVKSVAFKSEEEMAKDKKETKESDEHVEADKVEARVPESNSSEPSPSPSSSESMTTTQERSEQTTTTRTASSSARVRPRQVVQAGNSEGGGMMYDVIIMLLVAAIAALLYRRINLMGDDAAAADTE